MELALGGRNIIPVEGKSLPYQVVDISKMDQSSGFSVVKEAVGNSTSPCLLIMDIDGFLTRDKMMPFGLLPGVLNPESQEFLRWVKQTPDVYPLIFTARPLMGRFSRYLSEPGSLASRIRDFILPSTDRKTTLLKQFEECGLGSCLLYPILRNEIMQFPRFKRERVKGNRMFDLPAANSVIWVGDTRNDERYGEKVLLSLRSSGQNETQGTYIKCTSVYPLGIC